MKNIKTLSILILLVCCALVSNSQTKTTPRVADKNCHTEPNGDKIWYPEVYKFYPDGMRINFDGIPMVCRAGTWSFDSEKAEENQRRDQPRQDLLNALRTRPLTAKELVDLNKFGGSLILVTENVSYRQSDIDAQYAALLKVQELMQLADKCGAPKEEPK